MGNRAATWTHGFQTVSRGASSVAQPGTRGRGRTLAWPNGGQPVAPKALPTPSTRSPRVRAVSPPVDCDPPAGRQLRVNSGETALCLAPCPQLAFVVGQIEKFAMRFGCGRGHLGEILPHAYHARLSIKWFDGEQARFARTVAAACARACPTGQGRRAARHYAFSASARFFPKGKVGQSALRWARPAVA